MKFKLTIFLSVVLSFCLLGTVFAQETEETTLNLPWEPADQEAFYTPYWATGNQSTLIFSSLLHLDEDLLPGEGDLAKNYEVSSNNEIFTFNLKNNVKWHDGEQLTTEDVKWTIESVILNPRKVPIITKALESIKGAKEYKEGNVDQVEGLKIIDEDTIQITLTEPNAIFLNGLASTYILPKHLLKDEDPKNLHRSDFFMRPVGTGPYEIAEREPGNYTVLASFEDYFDGEPKIERVILRSWENIVPAAEKEEIDFGHVNDVSIGTELMDMSHMKVTPNPMAYLRFLALKVDEGPTEQLKVRKAIYHAIDRKAIAEDFFEGFAVPIDTNVYPGYWVNEDLEPYEYNPEKAKDLLEEVNWDSSQTVDVIYYYDDQETRDLMGTLQYYLDQVGIKIEPRLITGDATEIINVKRDYDICYMATACSDPIDHLGRFIPDFNTGTGFVNEEYGEAYENSTQVIDREERKNYIDECQEILHENVVTIPLYSPKIFIYEHERLNRPFVQSDGWWNHNYQWEKWEIKE